MTAVDSPASVRFPSDGLLPAIVQDVADGRILMLAWMDHEALEATLRTGEVHFHSRSRGRLWRKGETSGNVLRLRGIAADCDGDALLVTAEPAGPTCHSGARSCFDSAGTIVSEGEDDMPIGPAGQDLDWLEVLWGTIQRRLEERPEGSYTFQLVDGGVDRVARKVTEEATEVLLAARDDAEAQRMAIDRDGTRDRLAEESADLLYHLLVLLAERGLAPGRIMDVLRRRHGG